MKNQDKINKLQKQKQASLSRLKALESEKQVLNTKEEIERDKYDLINKELQKLTGDNVVKVSDHAIVRYLERKLKIDIQKIRQEMITAYLQNAGFIENMELKAKDNTITTIIDKKNSGGTTLPKDLENLRKTLMPIYKKMFNSQAKGQNKN